MADTGKAAPDGQPDRKLGGGGESAGGAYPTDGGGGRDPESGRAPGGQSVPSYAGPEQSPAGKLERTENAQREHGRG